MSQFEQTVFDAITKMQLQLEAMAARLERAEKKSQPKAKPEVTPKAAAKTATPKASGCCQAKTQSGTPCRIRPKDGETLCHVHRKAVDTPKRDASAKPKRQWTPVEKLRFPTWAERAKAAIAAKDRAAAARLLSQFDAAGKYAHLVDAAKQRQAADLRRQLERLA